jgi:ribosome-associated toxin RatA of RatAB toxin-antitoxin module
MRMHLSLTLLPLLLAGQLAAVDLPLALTAPDCVGCAAGVEHPRAGYSDDQWGALTRGEIVTSETQEANSGTSVRTSVETSGIISFPPAQVWSVVTDFEARPKFIPGVKDVHLVRAEGNRLWVAEHVRILLMNVRFQVICTLDPARGSVTWVIDDSAANDIAANSGSWQLMPLAGGQQTLARYRARVDTGKPVPRFIENFLVRRSAPQLMAGVRSEVERRFQQ